MNIPARNTLKEYALRHTGCREDILGVFYKNQYALSHSDLEVTLNDRFDRVTIYRTLKTFLDKGILHKVLDDVGGTKYALCKTDECSHEEHHHDHVHFKCTECGLTNCLDEVHIPSISLPQGYQRIEINMLVQGVCPNCTPNP
jgi:Fur family transcriptional regulator, ferric uptake regulator